MTVVASSGDVEELEDSTDETKQVEANVVVGASGVVQGESVQKVGALLEVPETREVGDTSGSRGVMTNGVGGLGKDSEGGRTGDERGGLEGSEVAKLAASTRCVGMRGIFGLLLFSSLFSGVRAEPRVGMSLTGRLKC